MVLSVNEGTNLIIHSHKSHGEWKGNKTVLFPSKSWKKERRQTVYDRDAQSMTVALHWHLPDWNVCILRGQFEMAYSK